MRTLIDGYNVMYAGGRLGGRLGPKGLRHVRQRFLNELAAALDPEEARQTTVVFDAAEAPPGAPGALVHKGLSVVFAADEDSADERIEALISADSAPRTLRVVSSDNRIRLAAARRRAAVMSADEYWCHMDRLKERKSAPPAPHRDARARHAGLSAVDAAHWLAEFAELDAEPRTREALNQEPSFVSDDEVARIQREVDREFRDGIPARFVEPAR